MQQKLYKSNITLFLLILLTAFCNNKKNVETSETDKEIGVLYTYLAVQTHLFDNNSSKKSEFWSDYLNKYNPVINENLMPNDITVQTTIYHTYVDSIAFSYTNSLAVSVKLQLKYGMNNNCLYMINPILSEEHLILNKEVKIEDFFKSKTYDLDKYKSVLLKGNFPIKKEIEKFISKNIDYTLSQIIVKTHVAVKDKKDSFTMEYMHPICVGIKTDN